MRIFTAIILLSLPSLIVYGQKRLNDSIVLLNLEIDSFKTLLADARREAKKCSDMLTILKDKIAQESNSADSKINALIRENKELNQLLTLRTDSLENSVRAASILQKIISENALKQSIIQERAKQLAQKLKDSIVDFPKNLCYIYSSDEGVRIVLSDSLIFGPNFYISNRGKLFLDKLLRQLLEETSTDIKIETFSNPSARRQEVWVQANARARQISSFFESREFPLNRYLLQLSAARPEHSNFMFPPTIIEITLK